jgi:hypothetical protein
VAAQVILGQVGEHRGGGEEFGGALRLIARDLRDHPAIVIRRDRGQRHALVGLDVPGHDRAPSAGAQGSLDERHRRRLAVRAGNGHEG